MICTQCQSIFPSHYKVCPVCQSKDIEKEKFVPHIEEVEEFELITAFCVDGDTDDMDGML